MKDTSVNDRMIFEKKDPELLYHFSDLRPNVLEALVFRGTERVLEAGAGCGALTGYLAGHGAEVTAVEPDAEMAAACEKRYAGRADIRVLTGLPEAGDTFDLIVLADTGWRRMAGTVSEPELICELAAHLREGGRMILTGEDPAALDSIALDGEAGYEPVPAQRAGSWLREAGLSYQRTAYPWPDHLYTEEIFTDEHLPEGTDLRGRRRNFRGVYAERPYRQALLAEMEKEAFPCFCNSYLIEASASPLSGGRVVYAKCSNDRAPEFAVMTRIIRTEDGERYVEKRAAVPAACGHVRRLAERNDRLADSLAAAELCLLSGTAVPATGGNGDGDEKNADGVRAAVRFPYLEGDTLEREVDALFAAGREEEALARIRAYLDLVGRTANTVSFRRTDGFRTVFGDADLPEDQPSADPCNIDLLMHNVIGGQVIDGEWTMDFPVPVSFVRYRVLYYGQIHGGAERASVLEPLYVECGITEEDRRVYARMESRFQEWIRKRRASIDDMMLTMAPVSFSARETGAILQKEADHFTMTVLRDGECAQRRSIHGVTRVDCAVPVTDGTKEIVIRPFGGIGILSGLQIAAADGSPLSYTLENALELNGDRIGSAGREPAVRVPVPRTAGPQVTVSFTVVSLDEADCAAYMIQFLQSPRTVGERFRAKLKRHSED